MDHLLTKFPQLGPIILIHNMAMQLLIGNCIVMEKGPIMFLDRGVDHARDDSCGAFRLCGPGRKFNGFTIKVD